MMSIREELNCQIKENEQKIELMELYEGKQNYDSMLMYNLKKKNTTLKHQFNLVKMQR